MSILFKHLIIAKQEKGNVIPVFGSIIVLISLMLPVYSCDSQIQLSILESVRLVFRGDAFSNLIYTAFLSGICSSLLFLITAHKKTGFITAVFSLVFLIASILLSQLTLSAIGFGIFVYAGGLICIGLAPLDY